MPPIFNRATLMLAVLFALLMLARRMLTGCGPWSRRRVLAARARPVEVGPWSPFREEIRRRASAPGG